MKLAKLMIPTHLLHFEKNVASNRYHFQLMNSTLKYIEEKAALMKFAHFDRYFEMIACFPTEYILKLTYRFGKSVLLVSQYYYNSSKFSTEFTVNFG